RHGGAPRVSPQAPLWRDTYGAAAQHELTPRQPDQPPSPVARSRPATRHDLTARPGRRASQVTTAEAASGCPFLPSGEYRTPPAAGFPATRWPMPGDLAG